MVSIALRSSSPVASIAILALACGGARTPAPSPAPAASSAAEAAPEASSSSSTPAPAAAPSLPTRCASQGEYCLFDNDFVDRLCSKQYVDATLSLFSNAMWTRAYLKGKVEAWNASGGASLRARLDFDEEVIVLRKRAGSSIMVGDNGGYDVLRWDGYCYSLEANNVTMKPPPKPRRALIPFFKIGKAMQDALLANDAVVKAYAKRMKECGGATQGDVSIACEKANTALSNAATDVIVSGVKLPLPDKIP